MTYGRRNFIIFTIDNLGEKDMYILRKLEDKDINLVQTWLKQECITKWFGDYTEWMDEIYGCHTKYSFIHHFIVENDNKPIGFCQYYDYCMLSQDDIDIQEPKGTYGIDYMIGEKHLLGKGIGKAIVKLICNKVLEENKQVIQIVADPTIEEKNTNISSIKVLEANQFFYDKQSNLYKKLINKIGSSSYL